MNEQKLGNLRYVTLYPKNFDESQKYPAILHLHGAGSRNKMDKVKNSVFFKALQKQPHAFVAFAPLCEEVTWFDHFHDLKDLVRYIAALPYVDADRLYLAGLSMGGYGAWQLGMSMPEYFAALVPVCGGGMYWNAGRLQNLPVWAFHGGKDPTVFPEESQKMVDAVNRMGGTAKLTVFPENGHDAWSDAYNTPELYEWLLSHKRISTALADDEYTDAKIYG